MRFVYYCTIIKIIQFFYYVSVRRHIFIPSITEQKMYKKMRNNQWEYRLNKGVSLNLFLAHTFTNFRSNKFKRLSVSLYCSSCAHVTRNWPIYWSNLGLPIFKIEIIIIKYTMNHNRRTNVRLTLFEL